MQDRDQILMSPEFVFFPKRDFFQFLSNEYFISDRSRLDDFLSSTMYTVSTYKKGKLCFYVDGQMCWNITTPEVLKHLSWRTVIMLLVLILFLWFLLWLLYRNLKKELGEDEKRKLALRILGHELRTPIASILLDVEQLAQSWDKLSEESQETLLGLTSNAHRLHRLVEMSKNYLTVNSSKQLIQVRPKQITSINEFVGDLAQEMEGVQFYPLPVDTSFNADEYWLMICLKNLINNASLHGKPPVQVFVFIQSGRKLEITVQDAGSCAFDSLDEMCSEFIKGPQSQGSGLGLHIIRKVLKTLGGELYYESHPTRFILTLKEVSL
jgi:signal transduction histidine kinase